MIEISGTEGTREHEAATQIAAAFATLWPGLKESAAEEELVRIAAGVKISGYRVNDIDILIAARVRYGRAFLPKRPIRDHTGARVNAGVKVETFVTAVELKDHDPGSTRLTGQSVEVRYDRNHKPTWHNATEQNIQQAHTVKAYLAHQTADVFVHRVLFMAGFEKPPCDGTIGGQFDAAGFLTAMCETAPVLSAGREHKLRAGARPAMNKVLTSPVFRTLHPTSLDRKRMDRIITKSPLVGEYLQSAGAKMMRLRGRGGTGKTVMLLQLAWRAFTQRTSRSVVLTYNHALAADITRLMSLLAIPSSPEGGIRVRTVMSFVSAWLDALEIDRPEIFNSATYEKRCNDALALLEAGAVEAADIEKIKAGDAAQFDFDLVIADEAQDWPHSELSLIKALYSPETICLADGVDQLIRGGPADWDAGVSRASRHVVPLERCLRMKRNLAVFANTVAERAGLNWKVEPNDEAGGGRIIIVNGALSDDLPLIEGLLGDLRQQGNANIDALFCVPPGDMTGAGEERRSLLATALSDAGYDIWDGTRSDERRDYPRNNESLRVVQYASCRGLEGWTVFLDAFDCDWPDLLRSDRGSANWLTRLMPLTRAIDTLVIALNSDNASTQLLLPAARSLPDIVSIR
ncbi:MAG: hypothetical protein WAU68_00950 [Vitreimonas sp.]